jgi:HK97 family phage portal protein
MIAVQTAQEIGIPPRPRRAAAKRNLGGAIISAKLGEPVLHKAAQRASGQVEQIFGVDSKEWSKELSDELKELRSPNFQNGEHKNICQKIIQGFTRGEIDAAMRASHKGEELPSPPAREPILIRRVTVPPEGLFLEEAVDKVPWVNRCLNLKAMNIGSLPLRVMRRQKNPEEPAENDTESTQARHLLRLLERPNAHQSGTDLIEAISIWMNTRQALVWMMWEPKRQETKPEEAKGKLPAALYCLPAHRCVGMMWEGSLLYYRVTGAGGLSIPAWQIIRIGYYNPKEEFRCLSPLSASFQCADTDYAMDLYNSNIFENGLKTSGILSFKQEVSDEKLQKYQDLVQQSSGVGNAHTVLVFGQEAIFETTAAGTKDMDYKGLAEANKNKITGSFGVPRAMLGDMEGARSLASATVARKSFWQDSLIPDSRRIIDKLNVHLVPFAGDEDIYLEPDLSKIEALADDRGEFATAFMNVSTALVALNQIQAVNQEDMASVLEDKFGIKVQGEEEQDPYEDDEEIMSESASVLLVKQLKGLVLNRMKLDISLGLEAVPLDRVIRLAQKYGMKKGLAQDFAANLAKNVSVFKNDADKVAAYFDGLKILAERRAKTKNGSGK